MMAEQQEVKAVNPDVDTTGGNEKINPAAPRTTDSVQNELASNKKNPKENIKDNKDFTKDPAKGNNANK